MLNLRSFFIKNEIKKTLTLLKAKKMRGNASYFNHSYYFCRWNFKTIFYFLEKKLEIRKISKIKKYEKNIIGF